MLAAIQDTQPREGWVIDGRLRLEERIGEGGEGDVWRATELHRGTSVAVKLLAPRHLNGASSRARVASFLREASLARRIQCPHVVRVTECGLAAELGPFLVMDLLSGLDLFEHITRSGSLELGETATLVAQLCVALESLHAADVFHRDVKPENVVLTSRGGAPCATLIDFSIAREGSAPEEVENGVSGTPAYLSPERIAGSCGDASGDLWALAVVAYQCLVGRVPFDDRTLGSLCIAVNRAVFTPVGAFVSAPPSLDAWFERALARHPADRFQTATEMREALIAMWAPFPLASRFRRDDAASWRSGRASGVRARLGVASQGYRRAAG